MLKNRNLLRQQKNSDIPCMLNTMRCLNFFISLHLTIFEQTIIFPTFNNFLEGHVEKPQSAASTKKFRHPM